MKRLIGRIKNSPYYHVIEIIGAVGGASTAVGVIVGFLIALVVQHQNTSPTAPVTRIVTVVERTIVERIHDPAPAPVVIHDKGTAPRSAALASERGQIAFVSPAVPSNRFQQASKIRSEAGQSRPSSPLMKRLPVTVAQVAPKRSPAAGALVGGGGCDKDCGDIGGCGTNCGGNTPPDNGCGNCGGTPPGVGCGDCGPTTSEAATDAVMRNNLGDVGCGCDGAAADPSRTSKAVPQAGMSSAKETYVPTVRASL